MRARAILSMVVASGAVSSTAIDLGQHWDYAWLLIQSMTSNSQFALATSDSLAGTYRRVVHPNVNTVTAAQPASFIVVSSLTNAAIPIPYGLRYLKIEQTATADSGQFYTVVVSGG